MTTRPILILVLALVSLLTHGVTAADEPTTVSATVKLRDVDLAELIEKAKLDLGYKVAGRVTVEANLTVPLGEATSTKAYVLKGKVTSAEVSVDELKVHDFTAALNYAGGKLTLTKLSATVPSEGTAPAGSITGTASAAIEPRGDLKADLTLTRLPLGILFKTLPGGLDIDGTVGGTAEFRAPVDRLRTPATWIGKAELTAPELAVFGRDFGKTVLHVALTDGKAALSKLTTAVEGVPVTGGGSLTLSGKYPYTANLRTAAKEVSELQKLVPELESPVPIKGKLTVEATASGTLVPLTVTAGGSISADDLAVGGTRGEKFSAKWKVTESRVTLSELTAGLFKGRITGSADVPFGPDGAGKFDLNFQDIDAAAVLASFPKLPVRVTGIVAGGITGRVPVTRPGQPRDVSAVVNLAAPNLTVQGIPAEKLVGKLSLVGTAVKYELEGKTLGGSFEVKGQYPGAKKPAGAKDQEQDGLIVIKSIDLGRLSRALRLSGTRLHGLVDLTFRFSADLNDGEGRYRLRDIGVNGTQLLSELGGRVGLRNGSLELADAVGPLSSGTVRARVRASLTEPTRNFYRLNVDRLDVGQLTAGTGRRSDLFDGGVSLVMRGKLYPTFTASGTLAMTHGRLGGITASDVRVPFRFAMTPGGGFQLSVPELMGGLGGGRFSGRFEYSEGSTARADGQVRFTNVKVGSVLSDLKQSNYFGAARVTGRIDLSGESMRSVNDVKATVVATIGQAGLRDLPVLTSVLPFVSPTALAKPFDTGWLRGRLSRGVFSLETLGLSSPNAELFAEGTVALSGRLDMGVIVKTGNIGFNDAVLRRAGVTLPLALVGATPVAVIRAVSTYLSNSTVRLSITGTLSNPSPRVNTAALLTDQAVRFFLRAYAPIAAELLPEVSPRPNR